VTLGGRLPGLGFPGVLQRIEAKHVRVAEQMQVGGIDGVGQVLNYSFCGRLAVPMPGQTGREKMDESTNVDVCQPHVMADFLSKSNERS
jgi:hypothetical protein